MEKKKVTSDELYKFLTDHHIIISKVSEVMGASHSIVSRSFKHGLDRLGKPIKFSPANLLKLNMAIGQIAAELRTMEIKFGSDQTYTNQRGSTYDPATVEAIQQLGDYFNLKGMTHSVLGWNETRKRTTLSIKNSPVYGNITKDDVERINMEVLSVISTLDSIEVVAHEDKD